MRDKKLEMYVGAGERGTDTGVGLAMKTVSRGDGSPVGPHECDFAEKEFARMSLPERARHVCNHLSAGCPSGHVIVLLPPGARGAWRRVCSVVAEISRDWQQSPVECGPRLKWDLFERQQRAIWCSPVDEESATPERARKIARSLYRRHRRRVVVVGPTESECPGIEQIACDFFSHMIAEWQRLDAEDPWSTNNLMRWEQETVGYSCYGDDSPWPSKARRPETAYGGSGVAREEEYAALDGDNGWHVLLTFGGSYRDYPKRRYQSAHRVNWALSLAAEHPRTCRLIRKFLRQQLGSLSVELLRRCGELSLDVTLTPYNFSAPSLPTVSESYQLWWPDRVAFGE